jgi:hypothetical protein
MSPGQVRGVAVWATVSILEARLPISSGPDVLRVPPAPAVAIPLDRRHAGGPRPHAAATRPGHAVLGRSLERERTLERQRCVPAAFIEEQAPGVSVVGTAVVVAGKFRRAHWQIPLKRYLRGSRGAAVGCHRGRPSRCPERHLPMCSSELPADRPTQVSPRGPHSPWLATSGRTLVAKRTNFDGRSHGMRGSPARSG